jgi:hypothetical protein
MNCYSVSNGKVVETVPIDFVGNRFYYSEIDHPTDKYTYFNGWPLLEHITETVLYFRPYCVVEIGAGESTKVLAKVCEKAGVKLYSCDKAPRKAATYFKDHEFHQKFSDDFMKDFNDTPAVVLIDADHHYDVAKMEFDFFWDRLVDGGIIFLHDTYAPHEVMLKGTACGDVYKLRQELEKRDDMDCFTFPYSANWCGLTMVIKKEKERPYWGV